MENNVNGVLWLTYGCGICFSHYIGYKIDIISNVGVINNGTERYTCISIQMRKQLLNFIIYCCYLRLLQLFCCDSSYICT